MRPVVRVVAASGWALVIGIAHVATIAGVSPQRGIAQVPQVTVRFSDAVVAFGVPRQPDPITRSCQGAAPPDAGHWATARIWRCDLRETLPTGTRCTLRARPGWKPSNGALTGVTEYHFNTGGPTVVSTQPSDGGQIAQDQYVAGFTPIAPRPRR